MVIMWAFLNLDYIPLYGLNMSLNCVHNRVYKFIAVGR
jgi:hypothetical protein